MSFQPPPADPNRPGGPGGPPQGSYGPPAQTGYGQPGAQPPGAPGGPATWQGGWQTPGQDTVGRDRVAKAQGVRVRMVPATLATASRRLRGAEDYAR